MRTTKKDIYASCGIEYDPKTQKIFHPVFGYIRPLLIKGNAKIGKDCFHFSTLPTNKSYIVKISGIEYVTKGTCNCHCVGCYATTGNYRFQSTINALGLRTLIIRNDLEWAKRAIIAQLKADNIKLCRIHASGDFDSLAYAEMWREIAVAFPDIAFWTYTKRSDCEQLFEDVPNANIVKSIVKGYGFNYGHCGYIINVYKALKAAGKSVYVCRCGVDKNQHCSNCAGCSKNEYVLFIEHSTEYKAERDPQYAELKAIIDNQ